MVGTWTARDAARALRIPTEKDDKYSRGVLGVRTGSDAYPGAAVLGVEAAWRSGIGMVRYVGDQRPTDLVLRRRPETVASEGRVQAWLIGSGTDAAARSASETDALRSILGGDLPAVVDAGALDLAVGAAAPMIVTPHAGEFARLRERLGFDDDVSDREDAIVRTADRLGATVLLKGARTLIASAAGDVVAVEARSAWLATAGTGDVLGGIVGALVAGRAADGPLGPEDLAGIAATAAWVHGAAARIAAGQTEPDDLTEDAEPRGSGRPIVALEVADAVPLVIGALAALA